MAGRGPDERRRRCPPGSGRSESSSVRCPEERPEPRDATGGAPEATDRPEIEAILARLRAKNFGFRSLIHEIVQSKMFREK